MNLAEDYDSIKSPVALCAERMSSLSMAPLRKSQRGLSIVLSDQSNLPKPKRFALPFKFVALTAFLIFTVGPSLTSWMLSWRVGSDGLDTVLSLSEDSLEIVCQQLRSSLVGRASESILQLLDYSETYMNASILRVNDEGILQMGGKTVEPSVLSKPLEYLAFSTRQTQWVMSFAVILFRELDQSGLFNADGRGYVRAGFNALTSAITDTLYLVSSQSVAGVDSVVNVSLVDPDHVAFTQFVLSLDRDPMFAIPLAGSYPYQKFCEWKSFIGFSAYIGLPTITLRCQLPFDDTSAAIMFDLRTSVYTISAYLLSLLSGAKERLFLTFRDADGVLIGASHGKFFSHSDLNLTGINPLTTKLPIDQFRPYTPLNSTDSIIHAEGVFLVRQYQRWDNIPELNAVHLINGEAYWVASEHIDSQAGMKLQLFLLVDRASRMGAIERSKQTTLDDIHRTNTRLIAILCCVVVGAAACAFVLSYFLTRSLDKLALGMTSLSMLRFDGIKDIQSLYSEVNQCESSFLALQRGMEAFVKYVPQDVVKMMLTGEMRSDNLMFHRTTTILFMDIVGFTTLCEKLRPETLVVLTTEYLQAMCEIIVRTRGVLDKFIGDCIMAMWNAPMELPCHEAAACEAALRMQGRLMQLCASWKDDDFPEFRFRIGIHTDRVLVGNFGCDYRINYTCLGDGVNLASRLEGMNKSFGTTVMVSQNTQSKAQTQFCFRTLGHITVPGKAEVVPVFEVLYKEQPNNTADALVDTDGNPLAESLKRGIASAPELIFQWERVSKSALDEMKTYYEKGIHHYLAGNLDTAEEFFHEALRMIPSDGASPFLISLCRQNKATKKVGTPWDGVIRFDKKG